MNENKPLVSVIIPTYNRVRTLPKAIGSVLDQTYDNLEIIVIDDGSNDGTDEYIRSIRDSRVHYVKNELNCGPAVARNKGARLAKGEYIAFQDSDDEWSDDKIEKQMKIMLNQEEPVDLVYCEIAIYEQDSLFMIMPPRDLPFEQKKGDLYPYLLLCPLIGIAMLVKKQEFLSVGGFNESLKALEDFEFSIRFSKNHRIGFVPEPLVRANDTPGSVSKQHRENVHTQVYIVKETLLDLRERGLLWEKIFIIKGYAAENECYDTFLEEMEELSHLLLDEEKGRLARILSTTIEEDEEQREAFKIYAYEQLLYMARQIDKINQGIQGGGVVWSTALQKALGEVLGSFDDYIGLFDVTSDIKIRCEKIKRRLDAGINAVEDEISLLTNLYDLINELIRHIDNSSFR